MTYRETIDFLFNVTPVFEKGDAGAYKPGLERMQAMAEEIGNPHVEQRYLHIAGTNGKGSVSSTLAAILTASGYRTGLFTSPHLIDFRERIRINGVPISEEEVVRFVERIKPLIERYQPSFFELTTLMALDYFARMKCDVVVMEVGMGGRLDCTNIITPLLSIITNVSMDHMQFLGNTLEAIAREKAGIFKQGVPALIGEAPERLRPLYESYTQIEKHYAEQSDEIVSITDAPDGLLIETKRWGTLKGVLTGAVQHLNARTTLAAVDLLTDKHLLQIPRDAVAKGFAQVVSLTHLLGRWQRVASRPTVILDTGHNEGAITEVAQQLKQEPYEALHIVFGMMHDKDFAKVLRLLPPNASYYFSTPKTPRALSGEMLRQEALKAGLRGETYPTLTEAFRAARTAAKPTDLIYAGGSNYVVAEILSGFFPELIEENKTTK